MESCDLVLIKLFEFQIRLESIETVNKILEEANKRIHPTGTGNDAAWTVGSILVRTFAGYVV